MPQLESLRSAVRKTLLDEWDPIGVRGIDQARDEYDQYVVAVARMIVAGEPASALSSYLLDVEIKAMGLTGNPGRARVVAERLAGLRHAQVQS